MLLTDPAVVTAAVVLDQPGDPAAAKIEAYVVLTDGDPQQVRRRAARMLPEYMVPATVTVLRALPLTGNGKLDLAQLPRAGVPAPAQQAGDDLLSKVLGVWSAQLRSEVAPTDNFFDLGGNSLLAARIVGALRDVGLSFTVRDVYRNPTPAALVSGV